MNEPVASHHDQAFSVHFEYPVHFSRDVFASDNPVLIDAIGRLNEHRRHRVQVFIDTGLAEARPELCDRIVQYFDAWTERVCLVCRPERVPGGEKAKNSREAAEHVMESIADHHLCRHSYVVAVGGGSALDIIGLAASLVHRGLRLVRIASTVLAQNDSAVGVKNGIDAYGMKNFAGTFAPPFAVLIDYDLLDTLPDKYWIGGMAEAFKVAIIRDRDFFGYLWEHADALRRRDRAVAETVIRRSALLHLEHIRTSGDPFEFGTARPLDFGHWSAHRIEMLSGYEIGHGQAVALGIALDTCCAQRTGRLSAKERDDILVALDATGLPTWANILERRSPDGQLDILKGLDEFREHLGGELNLTLPRGIGRREEIHEIDPGLVMDAVHFLRERQAVRQDRL
jgi:3-dehydroquinate synthase